MGERVCIVAFHALMEMDVLCTRVTREGNLDYIHYEKLSCCCFKKEACPSTARPTLAGVNQSCL